MRAFDRQARHQARQDFHLVLVHEQDTAKGACPFRTFFEQTPVELQKKYRLYDTLAVPLYPSPEHRSVSLRYALRNMGAVPSKRSKVGTSASAMQRIPSVKSILLKCWRRDPLIQIGLDEERELELTDLSRAPSSASTAKRGEKVSAILLQALPRGLQGPAWTDQPAQEYRTGSD